MVERFSSNIQDKESVSVHIRRTDFIDNAWIGGRSLDYYRAAIVYMTSHLGNPEFYFF